MLGGMASCTVTVSPLTDNSGVLGGQAKATHVPFEQREVQRRGTEQ